MHVRLFTRLMTRGREVYALKLITLAIAFAAFIVIFRFAAQEFSYDEFNDHPTQVFRVLKHNDARDYDGNRWSADISSQVTRALSGEKYRNSLVMSRVKILRDVNVQVDDRTFTHQKLHAADATITSVFTFDVLDGGFDDFHHTPGPVAMLSARAARQYLGTDRAVGKLLRLFADGDTLRVRVAVVFANFPDNTHEDFEIFLRYDTRSLEVLGFNAERSGIYGRSFERKPNNFVLADAEIHSVGEIRYFLQPLPHIYFGPRVLDEEARHGDRYTILILLCITGLILFLAVASYISLTTITLPHRARELAIKKLAGRGSRSLLFDFFIESSIIVGFSFILGILVLVLTGRYLEILPGVTSGVLFASIDTAYVLVVVVLVLAVAFAPLGLMRRFVRASPTRLLSTDTITFPRLKSYMTFLQLGIGIFLIVASIVVRRQITYSLVKEPGVNHDQVVYLPSPVNLTAEGVATLRANWKQTSPNILDVMALSQLPDRLASKEVGAPFYLLQVDPGFREFFGLKMERGNWFMANDGDSIIVTNDAGMSIIGDDQQNVVGVVEDLFHLFNQPSMPLKIKLDQGQPFHWLCIRVLEVDIRRTVQELSRQFSLRGNEVPVKYLNATFASWIAYQDRLNSLSDILAVISMALSCISIYGLSVSLVRDKLKQIAVHRLFGARTMRLTYLLARAFIVQALAALAIFGPVIYMLLRELLRTFVYATKLSWMDALYPVTYCVVVIFFVCFFQAISLNKSDFASALKGA